MPIRPESRWWIATLVIVGVLLGISALALNRPDVVWSDHAPQCPACRAGVADFATRCGVCQTQFEWTPSPAEESPRCTHCLSALEADAVRAAMERWGEEAAAKRVGRALGLAAESAAIYLRRLAAGRCGHCGGSGTLLARAEAPVPSRSTCPVCEGRGACIGCGGDRRVRLGDPRAREALRTYLDGLADLSPYVPEEARRAEIARLGQALLASHAGTLEAARVLAPGDLALPLVLGTAPKVAGPPDLWRSVDLARLRATAALAALAEVVDEHDGGVGRGQGGQTSPSGSHLPAAKDPAGE